MKYNYAVLLLLSHLLLSCYGGGGDTLRLNDDVLGLIVFKSSLLDPLQSLTSWDEDSPSPCAWRFVSCNAGNGRVSELRLDGLGLSGKIGRGLEKLQSLKVLSLSNNNLTGNISPELGLVPNLERLNLSRNSLSGDIPASLARISSLQFLDLSQNSLSGPVVDNMFENSLSLRFLSLASNRLEGNFPTSLSKCLTLNHLNLSGNHFSGDPFFSGGIWSLTRLRTLDLSKNALSGSIPIGISAIHNLKELLLHGNQFSGFLPADIGFCPHLTTIDFSNNLLTGSVPDSLQRLSSLSSLTLPHNSLTGDFPQWIGKLKTLEFLDLSKNSITGSLPSSMGDMKMLKNLILDDNKLTGAIPSSLTDSWSLSVVRLSRNSFNGSIPTSLFDMKLQELDLSRNGLTGFVPPPSKKLYENLEKLDLSGNRLIGDIPAEMGLLSKLRYLNLSWNILESRMPPEFGYFQNLTVLDIRNNELTGDIPGDICDSGSLAILQLDGNFLGGPIPQEIGNCSSLYLLSLSHNNLSGPIPESLSMLSKLKILKLEENELSGEIPQQLGKLENLLIANISHNRLVGRLPAGGIFPTLDATAIDGNRGICSPLIKGPCVLNVPKPLVLDPYAYGNQVGGGGQERRSRTLKRRSFLSVSAIVAIAAAVAIAAGVVVITLLNAKARRRIVLVDNALESMCTSSTRSSSNMASGKLIILDSKPSSDWCKANLDSLLNKATLIGEGVFGSVYKATMQGQGGNTTILAIKKLVTSNTLHYQDEFDQEVRVLAKARHPNLIALRGYYWTPNHQLLVTDYAPQGSVQKRLHEPSEPLTWPDRFKIVLGTAKGLSHLHHSLKQPIIHYNIKPSNILLDEALNPKISDFGLARLLTKLDKHVVSNRFQSAPGYVAPELACRSLRVNEKCDVYGFGVLILELVTGRRAVEYGEDNMVILSDHVRLVLEQGDVLGCVDGRMGRYPEEEVLPLLKLALVCTSQIPSTRPSMAEVVQILEVISTPVPNTNQQRY